MDTVEWSISAAEWLTGQGLAILVERGKLRELPARVRLKRWRDDMQDDDALRDIIHHAATVAAEGRLVHMIGEAVARHMTQPLPLGPVTVRRKA